MHGLPLVWQFHEHIIQRRTWIIIYTDGLYFLETIIIVGKSRELM